MPASLNQNLNLIRGVIKKGRYSNALSDIIAAKKIVKKNSFEYFQLLIWEIFMKIKLGEYSGSIIKLDGLIETFKKRNQELLVLKALYVKIVTLSDMGKFDALLPAINLFESLLPNIEDTNQRKQLEARILLKKGQYYDDKGERATAKELFEKSFSLCNELNDSYTKAHVIINLSIIARKEGDREAALNLLNKSLEIASENEFLLIKGIAFSNLAILYNINGKLDEALTFLQQGLDSLTEVGAIYNLARLLVNLGVVHHFSGNLNTSMNYYQQALENFQKVGNNLTIASTMYNIGLIYNLQGKLRNALANYEYTLPIFQELNNISLITAAYNSIGKVYFDLGLIEEAENHLSLVYQLKVNMTTVALSRTLFYLVQVLLHRNKFNMASDLVNELEEINENIESDVIKHRYLFLKGLILSFKDSEVVGNIEELYLQVINEPVTDHETTINAIINYCYHLIQKYSRNKNEEDLDRLKYYSERLSKLATKQQSKLLFAEHYWIKSLIASLENRTEEAKALLEQTKAMAEEMEFKRLLYKIEEFYKLK